MIGRSRPKIVAAKSGDSYGGSATETGGKSRGLVISFHVSKNLTQVGVGYGSGNRGPATHATELLLCEKGKRMCPCLRYCSKWNPRRQLTYKPPGPPLDVMILSMV